MMMMVVRLPVDWITLGETGGAGMDQYKKTG